MAETWSPPPTSRGLQPPGDGWTITGYQTVRVNEGGNRWNNGMPVARQIPIYTRGLSTQSPAQASGQGAAGSGAVPNDGKYENMQALYEQQMQAAREAQERFAAQQAEQTKALQVQFDQRLREESNYLNDLMLQQQQQAAQTQTLLQQQLEASQAAYSEQVRATAALSKAFVPALEPSAPAADTADQRTTRRKASDNSLSSLAITPSIGSNTNPLAGLQLA